MVAGSDRAGRLTTTTCSRRSSSSPRRCRTACGDGSTLQQGAVFLGGLRDCARELTRTKRIIMTACGTAWHSALVGEYLFEELARVPTEVEYASEFRYRNPVINDGTTVIAVSQSGETADTLAALRRGQAARGAGARRRERRRLDDRPRDRRRRLPARRSRRSASRRPRPSRARWPCSP